MKDKIKQAFEECEKFIDEHTPEELREYEESLNLDYESYYDSDSMDIPWTMDLFYKILLEGHLLNEESARIDGKLYSEMTWEYKKDLYRILTINFDLAFMWKKHTYQINSYIDGSKLLEDKNYWLPVGLEMEK